MVDVDDSVIYRSGDWTHRTVSANGSTFHLVAAGEGPLVLLLHGFADFWWTWRYQIPELAAAGYRVVAYDLRGYGGSDKPPRGYDLETAVSDVTGLVQALGEERAHLIGHDWGAMVAQATAALRPEVVSSVGILGWAHPLRLRAALATDRKQLAAFAWLFAFQLPRYEHRITAHNAGWVADMFHRWAGPAWRASPGFREHVGACRRAIQIQQAAFCAMEYYRWLVRSITRRSGWMFVHRLNTRITPRTWQIHGALDTCVLPATARGTGQFTSAPFEYLQLEGVGHFPHLEAPGFVTAELRRRLSNE